MPPDVLHFRPFASPKVHFSPSLLTTHQAQDNLNPPSSIHKYCQGSTKVMSLTKKKLISILVLVLSIISVLRLLGLTVKTSLSTNSTVISVFSQAPRHSCSSNSSTCNKVSSEEHHKRKPPPNITTTMTEKEFKILSNLIALKSPCNLLIFGFQPEYLILSSLNSAGSTLFLEDDINKIRKVRANSNSSNTQIYRVDYNVPAKAAYKLLKHARDNPSACAPNTRLLQESKCKLALKNLPSQVYEKNWDVIVVDGPSGDSPVSPGRMAPIYTASVLARTAASTSMADVIIHDVDRMIEKWFSREFLCDENLLHSKGKLWHFRIKAHSNSTRFCHSRESTIDI